MSPNKNYRQGAAWEREIKRILMEDYAYEVVVRGAGSKGCDLVGACPATGVSVYIEAKLTHEQSWGSWPMYEEDRRKLVEALYEAQDRGHAEVQFWYKVVNRGYFATFYSMRQKQWRLCEVVEYQNRGNPLMDWEARNWLLKVNEAERC